MVLKLICAPLLLIVHAILDIIPILTYIPNSIVSTTDLLLKAMQFFPSDVWIMVIGNITFWLTVHLLWGLIKFILSLVPFVNMGG